MDLALSEDGEFREKLWDNLEGFAKMVYHVIRKKYQCKGRQQKGGDSMGMTNKQFQGFLRLALELLERALQKSPDNEDLKKVRDIFQSMLEDD